MNFPYEGIPSRQFWAAGCHQKGWEATRYEILSEETPVISAGSCFARRIAHHLKRYGFHYLVTELGPPWLSPEDQAHYHYGTYSARYGNIYSSLQLWQLLERAWGHLKPHEDAWDGFNGVVDPYRPTVHFNGFSSAEEMRLDRAQHLEAVKAAFTQAKVFVFTLGLTDVWLSRTDGALFPLCPGKQVGTFSDDRYCQHTLGVSENMHILKQVIGFLKQVNPSLKVILSVSPVPLAATLNHQHILEATIYSKSVLRVCAQDIANQYEHVYYFPSYDYIQHAFQGEPIFDLSSRQLLPSAEEGVMKLFFTQFFKGELDDLEAAPGSESSDYDNPDLCDEGLLLQQIYKDFEA